MPMTTVFQSLARAPCAIASPATSAAPRPNALMNFDIVLLPCHRFFGRPRVLPRDPYTTHTGRLAKCELGGRLPRQFGPLNSRDVGAALQMGEEASLRGLIAECEAGPRRVA